MENCKEDNKFSCCLFFVANEFARLIGEMAEEEFKITSVSPSYAFVLMLVNKYPGIHPNELSSQLKLKPSTITRLLDKLVYQGYIERSSEGRTVQVFATKKGLKLQQLIDKAWYNLFQRYSKLLGSDNAVQLTSQIDSACKTIESSL